MWFNFPTRASAPCPPSVDPIARAFWRFYGALLLVIMAAAASAALWPADSITTSSRTTAAGSSSTGCPASTPGSSR